MFSRPESGWQLSGIDSLAMISSLAREAQRGDLSVMETRVGGGRKRRKREKPPQPEKPEGFQWMALPKSGDSLGSVPDCTTVPKGKLGWQIAPCDATGMLLPPTKRRTELTAIQHNTLMREYKMDKRPRPVEEDRPSGRKPTGLSQPPDANVHMDAPVSLAAVRSRRHPGKERHAVLAKQLNMSTHAVQIWFQNRRQRDPDRACLPPRLLQVTAAAVMAA